MALSRGVARVLRASVARGLSTPEVVAAQHPGDLEGLAAGAAFHGIAGYVYAATAGLLGVPETERSRLESMRRRTALDHLRVVADLRFVQGTFDEAGVPWLAFKGPTLAEPVHGSPELRSYSDLDVLVPPGAFGEALVALEAAGCIVLDRNWELIRRERKGEVRVQLPLGTVLDLHWHLLNDPMLREVFRVPIGQLFTRATTVTVGGRDVPTMDKTDTIVYVALHTMLSGADRLVWLKDLERLLSTNDAAPAEVWRRAADWGTKLVLATAVERSSRTLGDLPGHRELTQVSAGDHLWTALDRVAHRVSPTEVQDGSQSLARLFARSVRPSNPLAWQEARHKLRMVLRDRETPSTPIERVSHDAADPSSVDFDAGGRTVRDAFVSDVTNQWGTATSTSQLS